MFAKALFLVLLSSTFVFARSGEEEVESLRFRRSPAGEKVAEFFRKIDADANALINKIKGGISSFWAKLKGTDGKKKEQLNAIKEQMEALQKESNEAIEKKKADWQAVVADKEENLARMRKQAEAELQAEADKWDAKFEELMKKNQELVSSLN